jgi:rhodanese-related sulfurtransferase
LAPKEYDDYHLPRAINIPLGERFDRHIRSVVPENDTRLVVYCQDADCPVSRRAAERLEEIGYTNVADYAAGKEDWRRAGLPVR